MRWEEDGRGWGGVRGGRRRDEGGGGGGKDERRVGRRMDEGWGEGGRRWEEGLVEGGIATKLLKCLME